jgi:hypothetical protein
MSVSKAIARAARLKARAAGPRFRRVIYVLLGFVLGGVIGAVAGFAIGSAYVTAAQVSSLEGLSGYVVVYAFAFPGVIIGMVAGVAGGPAVGGNLILVRRPQQSLTAVPRFIRRRVAP